MKRGESYRGGQSSLNYLFGNSDNKQKNDQVAPPSPTTYTPPYGIDTEQPPKSPSPSQEKSNKVVSNDYLRVHDQNSAGNFITNRPSTKVKSAPGGDSSLGYLFGDE